MKRYLKETTAIALYAGLLFEASEILRGLGPNVDPNLKKLIIKLHQDRKFKHSDAIVEPLDKVTWRDLKDREAGRLTETGLVIAMSGTTGAVVVFPDYGDWNAVIAVEDKFEEKSNSSINAMLPEIKNAIGKITGIYKIQYHGAERKKNHKEIPDYLKAEQVMNAIITTLRPYIIKKAQKARAELNSRIQVMVTNDAPYVKISKKIQRKALIKQYLKNPEVYSNVEEKILSSAVYSTIEYYHPNSTNNFHKSTTIYGAASKMKIVDEKLLRKMIDKDREVLATVMYFIERAWLRIE